MSESTVTMATSHDVLRVSAETGQLLSFRAKAAPDQEFICPADEDPVFVIQYLDDDHRFRQISSLDAESTAISLDQKDDGSASLTATFRRLGALDLAATVTVRASNGRRYSIWSISLRNDAV